MSTLNFWFHGSVCIFLLKKAYHSDVATRFELVKYNFEDFVAVGDRKGC